MTEHNQWFVKIFSITDIADGQLEAWLNSFENDPRWRMMFAEKVVPLADNSVLVMACVEIEQHGGIR